MSIRYTEHTRFQYTTQRDVSTAQDVMVHGQYTMSVQKDDSTWTQTLHYFSTTRYDSTWAEQFQHNKMTIHGQTTKSVQYMMRVSTLYDGHSLFVGWTDRLASCSASSLSMLSSCC